MNEDHYSRWNLFAPLGLLLTGLGASMLGCATIRKSKGKSWFLNGTIALIVFNSGLAIFGEAVKERALYEVEIKQKIQGNG